MTVPFRRVMAANRGEIAIRIFRACTELGIQTVAIYSEEDRLSLHRYKADEAYLVGKGKTPIDAYLGIDEIVGAGPAAGGRRHPPRLRLPLRERRLRRGLRAGRHRLHRPHRRDAAQAGRQGGRPQGGHRRRRPGGAGHRRAGAPRRGGADLRPAARLPHHRQGGRRRRRARHARGPQPEGAARGAGQRRAARPRPPSATPAVFLERYIERPKHIEVQVLGDQHGNLVHLFERDCSVQRRHQKVVEFAPSLAHHAGRSARPSAPTPLQDRPLGRLPQRRHRRVPGRPGRGSHYFIEVNPRIQVEHTVTEHDHRPRPGAGADPDRPGLASSPTRRSASPARPTSRCAASPSSAASPPRTRRTTSPPTTACSRPTARPGGVGIRLDAGIGLRRRGHHARTTTRCW